MKWGAALWICAAALAAAVVYRHAQQPVAAAGPAPVPLSTPPGITLQERTVNGRLRLSKRQVFFADADGMTLYVHAQDPAGKAGCGADCGPARPPALAPAGAQAQGDWSLVDAGGAHAGRKQWAYRGAPLYRYVQDKSPGDVMGDAMGDGADGPWHAAAFRPGEGMELPDAMSVRELDNAGGVGLVDSQGLTLYTYDGGGEHAGCERGGACDWIALEAPQIAAARGDFAVLARRDGISQWTYRGRPLYKFARDQTEGEVAGAGADPRFHVALILRHFMPPDVAIRRNIELGEILSAAGATVYERDRPETSAGHDFRENHGWPALGRLFGTASCDADCARIWPPLAARAGALPSGYWNIALRGDGRRQWVYKGYAIYTYTGEPPGEIRGNARYDLAAIAENAPRNADHPAAGQAPVAADPFVPAGGDVAGIGVGAMFWHAVIP